MSVAPGTQFGPYVVTGPLGAGGMGEVYKARDSRLNRDVALKVLPAALLQDPDYKARFEREAQVLASLNHPNIAQIYGIEANAIVMELVPGSTLADRRFPLDEAIAIAKQIAGALEAAHEKGIIHRDLKPGNVILTPEGVAKVLDFGLAKAAEPSASVNTANSPTLTLRATEAGLILGTAGYMAPEQAAGKPVDKRADIWAFGVVLFELLTGQRLFHAETVSHTLADVLRSPIDFDTLPKGIPPAIRALLKRCLDRDPKLRLRDIGEARVLLSQPLTVEPTPPAPSQQSRTPWLIAAAAALALCAAAFGWFQATRRVPQPLSRFDVEMGEGFHAEGIDAPHVIISPDGRRIVSQLRGADGKVRLAVRALEDAKPTVLPGTEGATHQFFSPDGEWIGYQDRPNLSLRKISIRGGTPVTVCPIPNLRGASWGVDGTIVVASGPATGLQRVSANGGTLIPLTELDKNTGERSHRGPFMLPGGKAALFFSSGSAGGYENATIEAVSLGTGQRTTLIPGGFAPRYSPSGHILFMRQGSLFAVTFDAEKLQVTGSPVAVVPNVRYYSTRGSAEFDVSPAGTLIFIEGAGQTIYKPLVLVDATGARTSIIKDPQEYSNPRFSRDRTRIAFDSLESGKRDVWVYDPQREIKTRLTLTPGEHANAVWTPDGERIAYGQADGIYWVRSGGGGEPERLLESKNSPIPVSFSPDGKVLAYQEAPLNAANDIRLLEFDLRDTAHPRPGKSTPLLTAPFDEREPLFSPDGKWLAYESNESGTNEVYVRSYPDAGGRWQISNGGGFRPRWSPNRKELLFTAEGKMFAVSYSAERNGFVASKPRLWGSFGSRVLGYDITQDGNQILLYNNPGSDAPERLPTRLVFLLNFLDELKRRIP